MHVCVGGKRGGKEGRREKGKGGRRGGLGGLGLVVVCGRYIMRMKLRLE